MEKGTILKLERDRSLDGIDKGILVEMYKGNSLDDSETTSNQIGVVGTSQQLAIQIMKLLDFGKEETLHVTFCGGNESEQAPFIRECAGFLKEYGIQTCLHTGGSLEWTLLDSVLDHMDSVIYNFYSFDKQESVANIKNIASYKIPMVVQLKPSFPTIKDMQVCLDYINSLGKAVKQIIFVPCDKSQDISKAEFAMKYAKTLGLQSSLSQA